MYKNNWIIHKNTVLVQSEARSKTRITVLSNSIARNRSFQHTHYLGFVVRNSQDYRASYLRQIRNVDVRILQISKRENPPTIKANKASGAGKPVAHSIQEKVSDVSSGTLVAVTLITEFQVLPHTTVQKEDSNRKETVKRPIQQFENHPNRDSLIEDLPRLKSSIRSAKSRRS